MTNGELGVLPAEQAEAIAAAAREVADGQHDAAFPIDVFQTGSGTSSNMNANEVIADPGHPGRRRGAPQRPRQRQPVEQRHLPDRDPRGRDPRGRRGPAARARRPRRPRSRPRPTEFAGLVKSGRTHLMDATPVMLGQEFGGYAATVRYGRRAARVGAAPGPRAPARRHRRRHRHQHPGRLPAAGDRGARPRPPASRSPRPATTSRPRAPGTRSSSCPACCARSRSA